MAPHPPADWQRDQQRLDRVLTRLRNDLKREFGARWGEAFAYLIGTGLAAVFHSADRDRSLRLVNGVLYSCSERSNVIPQVIEVPKAELEETGGTEPSRH